MARPSTHTPELAAKICERLMGGESLRSICRNEDMPNISTVLLWVVQDREGFSAQYREAREAQGYYDGDKVRDIAEKVESGELEPQAAKVIIDAYKWTAGRNAAKVYGDRIQPENGNTGTPVILNFVEAKKPDDAD